MANYFYSGVALAKKKGKDIHIVETPVGIGDFIPVVVQGGTVARTLKQRFSDQLNVRDFGAVGDGVTDDTVALLLAVSAAKTLNVSLVLNGGKYLVSSDIDFSRPVKFSGYVEFLAKSTADIPPTVNLYFSRPMALSNVSFTYVNVKVSSPDGALTRLQSRVELCSFLNSTLTLGSQNQTTDGYYVGRNRFSCTLSRETKALTVFNANNACIENNEFQEYSSAVSVEPSLSFSAHNIRIVENTISNSPYGIQLFGSSMHRVTNCVVARNVISSTRRDTTTSSLMSPLLAKWCINLTVEDTNVTATSDAMILVSVLGAKIDRCKIHSIKLSAIRAHGCQDVFVDGARLESSDAAYPLLAIAPDAMAVFNPKIYPSKNWQVSNSEIRGTSLGVSIRATDHVRVFGNKFYADKSGSATGLLHLINGNTDAYQWDNVFRIPDGNTLVTGGTEGVPPNTRLDPPAESVVSEPVITASDTDLNGAKSYVLTFTLGDVHQLHQVAKNGEVKTLSNWVAGTSAKLAFNSNAFQTSNKHLGDVVVDGVVIDEYGSEDFWWSMSMALIDTSNRLSCRMFQNEVSTRYPLQIGARSVAERAWQTVAFRPPLVVDGAVYIDKAITVDLISENGAKVQLSGRVCLGQKLDGTYVLLVVDGKSGESGCTIQKAAEKMLALGCVNAFNFDGGGSATLWYNGAVINNPSDGSERAIPCAMYVV